MNQCGAKCVIFHDETRFWFGNFPHQVNEAVAFVRNGLCECKLKRTEIWYEIPASHLHAGDFLSGKQRFCQIFGQTHT
jgi:hypothetical protein